MTGARALLALVLGAGLLAQDTAPDGPRLAAALATLRSQDGALAERAWATLAAAGEAAGTAALAALAAGPGPGRDRLAQAACAFLPAPRSAELLPLLADPDVELRVTVVRTLGRRDQPGWRDAQVARIGGLLRALTDADVRVRQAAGQCLSWFDDPEAARGFAGFLTTTLRAGDAGTLERAMVERFARQPSARAHLSGLVALARERQPALLPVLVRGLGTRPESDSQYPWLELLAHPDFAVRQAAATALDDLDSWLFRVQDHAARLRLLERAQGFSPDPDGVLLRRAHVALMDAADDRLAGQLLAQAQARPFDPRDAEAVLARADLLSMQAIHQYLTGHAAQAHGTCEVTLSLLRELQSRDPQPPRDGGGPGGADQATALWELWRRGVLPVPEPGELARTRRTSEAYGGIRVRTLRAALRAQARVALLSATLAALDADALPALFPARIDRVAELFETLDRDWWEETLLGPCRDWDVCLEGRAGPVEFLTRALENRKRNDEAEIGFHRLLAALNGKLPEVFPGRPVAARPSVRGLPEGGPEEAPSESGEKERCVSALLDHLARFYERIGERQKAAICHERVIARLEKSGLSENRSLWAQALFARGGIALESHDPGPARECLDKYLRFYEARRVDVEQRPDYYGDPEAAKEYYKRRLAQGYVSLAVLHNVVLKDTASARKHCLTAYELEDSPFNRILYACYLSRDGRKDEALALAASVEAIPELYYNLACTYSLAGKAELALLFLGRDLQENHTTPKKRNSQREWARKDRDFESLRGSPGFETLLTPEPEK